MPRAKRDDRTPQEKILDAALLVFSSQRFDLASTNQIAKEAKVAKGLLFHYFKSKEELYLAVAERTINKNFNLFWEQATDPPADLFERLQYWSLIRLRLAQQNPQTYHFLSQLIADCPPSLKLRVASLMEPIQKKGVEALMKDLDTSRLRKGITIPQAIEMLILFSSGLEKKFIALFSSAPDHGYSLIETVTKQSHEYFSILRDGLYERSS
jgi:TetR/AcrR family transcriptional regulator